MLFAGWAAYNSAREHRQAALSFARQTVARVGERVTAEMSTQARVAETLAQAASLPSIDLSAFYGEARRVQAVHPLWYTVELDDPDGNQRANLLRPLGSPLGATADRSAIDEVVNDRRPLIGGIGPVGPVSGKRLVALHVPVIRDGTLVDILTVALAPDAVGTILRGAGIPEGWFGVVVDRSGHIIARSVDDAATTGQPASPTLQRAILSETSGFYAGVTREGVAVTTVFETLPDIGHWSVHLGIPRDALDGPVRRALYAVAVVAALTLALAVALVTLLARDLAVTRRREEGQAAASLEASEERATLAVEAADLGTWRWEVDQDRIYGSERFRTLLYLAQAASGEPHWSSAAFLGVIHPDDRPALDAAVQRGFIDHQAFELNFRAVSSDGTSQWRHARGRAAAGPQAREIRGILADIDAAKRSQEERSDLLRRLASAQEEVERRIAHDLHDQVGQTLTGLSLGLKGLEQALKNASSDQGDVTDAQLDLEERVHWLQSLTGNIGRDLHRVASDLRPTSLDDLGLPGALAALAADWAGRFGIAVDVQVVGAKDRLPDEIASVVYRVVQEALTNVLKHASARTVSIVMDRRPKDVRVVIEDDGVGIDEGALQEATTGTRRRLGLSGMRERLSLIGGALQIESSSGTGTTLFVTIPLDLEPSTKDAA